MEPAASPSVCCQSEQCHLHFYFLGLLSTARRRHQAAEEASFLSYPIESFELNHDCLATLTSNQHFDVMIILSPTDMDLSRTDAELEQDAHRLCVSSSHLEIARELRRDRGI